ncbi:hypothetical protein KIH74_29865 [Kineosporia sp. J2-2]|uniref:Uncharacterized protein n=1 Tax=Kineosporia corallincola TaxID=2835133 RepID=A0ABS5TR71_9ACTN|nr:hypothetical protein [Kineosporia corallincola]MBT0773188.1 hypothetical protein [Kineosporia corallincola]
MIISRAGFFRELPHGLPTGESLRESLPRPGRADPLPQAQESRLLRHLWGNTVLVATGCLTDDVLDPSAQGVAPLEMVTDGAWVWPRDLAHYVEKYHVAVPLPFVLHLELLDWAQPRLHPDQLLEVESAFLEPFSG